MRLLLDTHVALWAITDDARLTARARDLITADDAEVFISAVVLWEIAIKHGLGRGGPNAMPVSAAQAQIWFEASNFRALPITAAIPSPSRAWRPTMPIRSTGFWSPRP